VGPYVDWSQTVDTFKAGDPDTEVEGIAVSWMSTMAALRRAHAGGCNLFITHEPTFYSHNDDDRSFDGDNCVQEKRAFLTETGMVVYRCHDVWDRFPGEGILDSWAAHLGLTAEPLAAERFMRVVPIEPQSAVAFTRDVARRLTQFGQEAVPLVGDPEQRVSRVGIGTGAIASGRDYVRMGADVGIATELFWWRDARWSQDWGLPLLVVDHTASEEPGLINLAAYLRRQFPHVAIEYIPAGCPYMLIGPSGDY
jgi:putative NIF3 family GTP cyclohydrolase 1 type 2